MAKAMGSTAMLPLMLLLPAVLLIGLLAGIGHLEIPDGHVLYEHFLPHLPLQLFFGGFAGLAILMSLIGAVRYWRAMERQFPPKGTPNSAGASFVGAVKDILTHTKFSDCTQNKSRYYSHLLTFYGFLGLFITTVAVVVSVYVFHYYPLPLFHPLKIFGNLSTLAMVIGVTWIIADRASKPEATETSTGRDWTFILILFTVVLTGIATEVLRYADVASVAYPVYFIHLVFVFALLIYLPYSRFAHMIYRTVALTYARYSGREQGVTAGNRAA
jgi:quinone-modifying oxidoreductase subunit QmoC